MASKRTANKKKVEEPVVEPEAEEEEEVEEASEEEVEEEAEEAEAEAEEEAEEAEEAAEEADEPEQAEETEKPKAENVAAEGNQRNGLSPEERDAKRQEQRLLDERSVFVGNLPDDVTSEQLTEFFKSVGEVERVTLLTDKMTGKFKGCGFVLFKSKDTVQSALELDGNKLQDKDIQVKTKRTNVPGWMRGGRGGRGRGGFRGGRGGRGGGGFRGGRGGNRGGGRGGGFRGRGRGRGGGYQAQRGGRGGGQWHPYGVSSGNQGE